MASNMLASYVDYDIDEIIYGSLNLKSKVTLANISSTSKRGCT